MLSIQNLWTVLIYSWIAKASLQSCRELLLNATAHGKLIIIDVLSLLHDYKLSHVQSFVV